MNRCAASATERCEHLGGGIDEEDIVAGGVIPRPLQHDVVKVGQLVIAALLDHILFCPIAGRSDVPFVSSGKQRRSLMPSNIVKQTGHALCGQRVVLCPVAAGTSRSAASLHQDHPQLGGWTCCSRRRWP